MPKESSTANRSEIDTRLTRVLDEAVPDWRERQGRSDEVAPRPVDVGGRVIVIGHVPNRAERGPIASALIRHLPDLPYRFDGFESSPRRWTYGRIGRTLPLRFPCVFGSWIAAATWRLPTGATPSRGGKARGPRCKLEVAMS